MEHPKFHAKILTLYKLLGGVNAGIVFGCICLHEPFYKYSFQLFCALFFTWVGFDKRFKADETKN
jgi:hypothetical protein